MSTHNIGFYEDLTKIIFELSSNTHLIISAESDSCLLCLLSRGTPCMVIHEPRREKTNVLVSDLFQHKPGCRATEYG